MIFEIDKPESELTEGYFNLFLKYLTLFIVAWLAGWLLLLFYDNREIPSSVRSKLSAWILDNPTINSTIVAIGVIYYFGRRAYRKFKLGLITKFDFNDTNSVLTLGLLNTINGSYHEKTIAYKDVVVTLQLKEDKLFGKQRVFEILDRYTLVNRINIELTAWCRHSQVEAIVNRLNSFIEEKKNLG